MGIHIYRIIQATCSDRKAAVRCNTPIIHIRSQRSCGDRIRSNVGIQCLPNERHPLRQPIRVECSRTDLCTERRHLLLEELCSSPGLWVHAAEHVPVVEHVDEGSLSADEFRSSK